MSEIVLRDLQSVLRKELGNDLIVEKFEMSSLVPAGENYGSTIRKVCASVNEGVNGESRKLHLVAKMLPPTEFQREVFNCVYTVKKEIFFYRELLPVYNELEMESGIAEEDVFDVLPKFYGSRLSMSSDIDAEVDEDSVILLENLKEAGYYTVDRKEGLDLEHAEVVVRTLARFHALGMAMKYKKPKHFEVLKHHSKSMRMKNSEEFEQSLVTALETASKKDPILAKYSDRCKSSFCRMSDRWSATPEEPWSTIIHSDFWVANFLLRKNAEGKVEDVKFVDFQNYVFSNSLKDLVFLLGISLAKYVADEHFEELLDLYYATLILELKKMRCDVSLFSEIAFHEQLKKIANIEFGHCFMMSKILTLDTASTTDFKTIVVSEGKSQLYHERVRGLTLRWIERGWL